MPTDTTILSLDRFTSSEAGAWSNSYLISAGTAAILFDVFMLSSEAAGVAKTIYESGKSLETVIISHAHPDHFMGLDAILDRFPSARVVSTKNVAGDIRQDGPWMFSMLQSKLGAAGPKRLIVPDPLSEPVLSLGGNELEIVEFGECESKHIACLHIPSLKSLLTADLVYHNAHLYLAEKHIASWRERLGELEAFAGNRDLTLHPGHGAPGGLELISQTRAYLDEFAEGVTTNDAKSLEERMLARYPQYHVRQFLTAFSIPAFFPAASTA